MSRPTDRALGRPLPRGLRICETCGEVRGVTQRGRVSACYCSGLVCRRCGGRARRPITDYVDIRNGRWSHVPYFGLMAHRCSLAPGQVPGPTGWEGLEPAPEVVAYQEAMNELAWALIRERQAAGEEVGLEIVSNDGAVIRHKLGPIT